MHKVEQLLLICVFLFVPVMAFAQQKTISGTVTSATDGLGVIGAAVMEKGTTNGTTTDIDGKFAISVKEGAVLEISSLGYLTLTVPATDGISVVMQEDINLLEEVVVTGYTAEKKADLTGSVSVIKMKDIADVPTGNVLSSLNGRVPVSTSPRTVHRAVATHTHRSEASPPSTTPHPSM